LKQGTCRYCKVKKDLCGAHIIPKKFYFDYTNAKYKSVNSENGNWKQSQNGAWDDSILCPDCDGILNNFDREGYRVLLQDLSDYKKTISSTRSTYLLNKESYDYVKLRCFFISMLWRASISQKSEFNQIKLGPYEDIALKIIKNEIEEKQLFKIIIFREPDNKEFNKVIFAVQSKFANKICYYFYFAQFKVCIIPSIRGIRWKSKALDDRSFFNDEELLIIEDESAYEDKLKTLASVKQNIEQHKKLLR